MGAILSPAMAVMKRLRFGGKFALISAVFVLPIVFLLWLLVSNMNAEIAFAQKERLGVSYNRAMLSLLQHMQQHRGMASGLLNGDGSFAPRLEAMEAKIAKDAEAIDALEREHGEVLATTVRWNAIKKSWLEVRGNFKGMTPPQSFAAHTTITQSILDQIAYAGDTSNLTVDPDLDSYYLMNTFVGKLPDASESTGQARAVGTGVATRKSMEPAERANLMLLISKSEGGYRNAMVNLDKAANRNPAVAGAVKDAKALVEATGRFVKTAHEKVIDAKQIEIAPTDYFAVATQAIDDNFKANEVVATELDRLLVLRIQALTLHKWQTLGAVGVVLLLASLLLAGFYRVVNDGLARAGSVAAAVAGGNLAIEIRSDGRDETAQLLDTLGSMQQELVAIVSRIRDSSEQISSASSEIAAGNADLSQRTEEQASSLEETASSMEELTSTVKQNAENAMQANQLASGASSVAVRGGEVVSKVVHTMSGISESSKKIADIIGVIDGIAFQTNILALNAAVEAARAGEQGRGFAVVATEVRNLAQKSAAAAKEIKTLIVDSVAKVQDGSKLVDEAGKTMEEIVASIKRVTDIMAEITAASREQSSGIEQVNTAITQMDQVTQQNAALVEQAAAAAESMQEQAQELVQVVAVFKLASDGQASVARASANVTRLPVKAAAKPAALAAPKGKKVSGGDAESAEWEEF